MTNNDGVGQMGLIQDGIENVMAFELPCGIWADGRNVEGPRVALVKWRSSWADKFHQVYVNGRFAGTTVDGQQRQMVVHLPSSLEVPVRIEVFAVEQEQADIDFCDELDCPAGLGGRVKIQMLRGQNLAMDATAQIFYDAGTGEIDYENPLNDSQIHIWPCFQDKAGFGMSGFGVGDFGYDSPAAVGFGKGSFGLGQFGLDADMLEWISPQLQAGEYRFAVKVFDQAGDESISSETSPVVVTPLPRPAEQVSVLSFDKQTNGLVLKIGDRV